MKAVVLFALVALFSGCSDSDPPPPKPRGAQAPPPQASGERDAPAAAGSEVGLDESLRDRGRAVYTANCSACHNRDPSLPGNLGPPVAGSSLELLEARLLRNAYPEGYTPKRDSRVMMALPYLKDDIPSLAAYLTH
ncbi:MAG: cytochrome c [Myxococcota bacterium]|nr:cytochrome c [Myxococcota bacterium]